MCSLDRSRASAFARQLMPIFRRFFPSAFNRGIVTTRSSSFFFFFSFSFSFFSLSFMYVCVRACVRARACRRGDGEGRQAGDRIAVPVSREPLRKEPG
jgi:hypothetical protein